MGRLASLLRRPGAAPAPPANWAPPLPPPRAEERVEADGLEGDPYDGYGDDDPADLADLADVESPPPPPPPPPPVDDPSDPAQQMRAWTDWNAAANQRAAEPDWRSEWQQRQAANSPAGAKDDKNVSLKALVIGGLALMLVVAGAVVVTQKGESGPRAWDPQIKEIVSFVETERSLFFKHPVPVEYLEDAKFRDRIADQRQSGKEPSKAERADEAMFRALGLMSGSGSLSSQADTLTGEGVLAYYSFADRKIVVRGTTLDVATKVTLAHELTHALDDQHFDLARTRNEAKSSLAALALIEGNAMLVEQAYLDQLPAADLDAYQRTVETQAGTFTTNTQGVSDVLAAVFAAPYRLGPALVAAINEANGPSGINDAFRLPPESDEQALQPSKYVKNDKPKPVGIPALEAGEELNRDAEHDEPFGAFGLYLVLAARIDPKVALTAAKGWGGDDYVQFTKGNQQCARLAFVGDTPADTDRIAAALDQWVQTKPGGSPSAKRVSANVELTVCDPGAGAATPPLNPDPAALVFVRADLLRELLLSTGATKMDPAAAECAVDQLGTTVDLAALDKDDAALPTDFAAKAAAAMTACKN